VETADAIWDAFEAPPGRPFVRWLEEEKWVPWANLRHWLCDLTSELWEATTDQTLPEKPSLNHVWITTQGQAVLFDQPWPLAHSPAERIPVRRLEGQQRFLNAVAQCVDSTTLPLHAGRVLQNLEAGRFEKLSYLTGVLKGLLQKPPEISRAIRAGSVFMLPVYVWIMLFLGNYQSERSDPSLAALFGVALTALTLILAARMVAQLLEVPFRTTCSHAIFRLVVVDEQGRPASRGRLLLRWAIVWLPLLPVLLALWARRTEPPTNLILEIPLLLMWIAATLDTVLHPHCGLQDRLARTRVVRR
jgi:hypothetical protein